jgi:hypothetical protein
VAAVARLRYQVPVVVPNSIGNDEEMILGQVVAESIAKRRPPAGPLPSLDLPAPDSTEGLPSPLPAATAPIAPPPRLGTVGVLPGTVRAGRRPPSGSAAGRGAGPNAAGTRSVGTTAPASSGPGPSTPTDSPALDRLGLGPASAATPSDRVRSGYGSFILAALAGAALFLTGQRTRLT